jgi:hypothetical protein
MSAVREDELELLDAKQIADLLHVPITWVQQATRARAKDPIPHLKIGHYTRFQESAVRDWLEARKKNYPLRKR